MLSRPALLLSQPPEIVITGHLTGHVQGALLVLPAQHSTAGLEELTLSKDSKRTGNFSWLFTGTVICILQGFAFPQQWWDTRIEMEKERAGANIFSNVHIDTEHI